MYIRETPNNVAGTPPLAQLYTADSGTGQTADARAVYVQAANVGPLGNLSGLSASYHLFSSSGGNGNQPYWLTYLYAPSGGYVGVISFGGPDLNSSSQIHVIYDYATVGGPSYFGLTLAQWQLER